MKTYSAKLKADFMSELATIIGRAMQDVPPADDEDRLLLAGLFEIRQRLLKKMVEPKGEFKITFTPVQAISLRLFFRDLVDNAGTDYGTNRLRQLADEIHQHYS
jgi:hypothetical protein